MGSDLQLFVIGSFGKDLVSTIIYCLLVTCARGVFHHHFTAGEGFRRRRRRYIWKKHYVFSMLRCTVRRITEHGDTILSKPLTEDMSIVFYSGRHEVHLALTLTDLCERITDEKTVSNSKHLSTLS